MSFDESAPEGYHFEWQAEACWRVPADGRKCSRARCLNSAIALLQRNHAGFRSGIALWGYCADHLYGLGEIRKIEDGMVKVRAVVKNQEISA